MALRLHAGFFVRRLRSARIAPSGGSDPFGTRLPGSHSFELYQRFGAVKEDLLDAHAQRRLWNAILMSEAAQFGADDDLRHAVDSQRFVQPGNEEDDADPRVAQNVLQRIDAVIARTVRN
jgi:hypothetical protein